MRSKITIDTAANFKPCIRVREPHDNFNEDVRDKLVIGFRELLGDKSRTVQIIFEDNQDYILYPVEDELKYFMGKCMSIVFPNHGTPEHKAIESFFAWIEDPAIGLKIDIPSGPGSITPGTQEAYMERVSKEQKESFLKSAYNTAVTTHDRIAELRKDGMITFTDEK